MGDWILVQRRGRRRPARPPYQDRRDGWMASATSVPYGGRNNFRIPNPNPSKQPTMDRYGEEED